MREAEREAAAALDAARAVSREVVEAAQAQAASLETQATSALSAADGEAAAASRVTEGARAEAARLESARAAVEGTMAKTDSMVKRRMRSPTAPEAHPRAQDECFLSSASWHSVARERLR